MAPKRARRPPPVPVNLNVTFGVGGLHKKNRFIALKKRPISSTKFPFLETLEKFGMLNGVTTLLEKGGLAGMLQKSAPTWKRPTLEFLASLERTELNGERAITFQLMGEPHVMTYTQVATALGWSVGGTDWNPPNDLTVGVFWQDLTGKEYRGKGGNKINYILHPCFRYVLRLLNTSIFGGSEPGQVQKGEIKNFWALSPEGVGRPPWVELFVTKCLAEQNEISGNISFGGLITLLAEALPNCGAITPNCGVVQPLAGYLFDDHTLKRGYFIDFDMGPDPNFRYRVHSGNVPLPPEPERRFDIPNGVSTFELRQQFWFGAAIPEVNVGTEEPEREEGRDEENYGDEGAVGDEAGGSSSSADPWRQHIDQELGYIRDDIQTMRGEMQSQWDHMNMRYTSLESQFSRMFSYQEAMMDYFAQIGGAQFRDPRQAAREEAARQEELRRQYEAQQRRYDPGGPSGC